jgi:hypothetical protein
MHSSYVITGSLSSFRLFCASPIWVCSVAPLGHHLTFLLLGCLVGSSIWVSIALAKLNTTGPAILGNIVLKSLNLFLSQTLCMDNICTHGCASVGCILVRALVRQASYPSAFSASTTKSGRSLPPVSPTLCGLCLPSSNQVCGIDFRPWNLSLISGQPHCIHFCSSECSSATA